MPENNQNSIWPMPKFYFKVLVGNIECSFQEVSGLDTETQIIDYRHGNPKDFSTVKMPSVSKYSNVTLKKGLTPMKDLFFNWYDQFTMNTIQGQTVTIQLMDESGKSTMTWTLSNAWPTKITGPDLKSDGNEVAIETLEIAHEGLTIANG